MARRRVDYVRSQAVYWAHVARAFPGYRITAEEKRAEIAELERLVGERAPTARRLGAQSKP